MKPARQRRRSFLNALRSARLVNVLRALWIVFFLWYELGTFWWSVSGCRWPDQVLRNVGFAGQPAHVLLIADPQILDSRSYPGRSAWLMSLSQFIVDLYVRKSWSVATRFRPDVVVFLGDMMDGGRYASGDDEYTNYFRRFQSMFQLNDPEVDVYYIPGNHDVGLGNSPHFHPRARQRYQTHFGPLNQKVVVGNHTFILLDAPGLVEEDYIRASDGANFEHWTAPAKGTVEFIRKFASTGSEDPVVLFSHIPLFRPDTATCGPLRERGTIRRGVGHGYQNTLGKHTTEYLLQSVRPVLVFSGDDHDYCEYNHRVPLVTEGPAPTFEVVKEVTVKAFSMSAGIKRPGFQLLSLAPPPEDVILSQTTADTPCLLPDQLSIYIYRYFPLFILSLFVVFISTALKVSRKGKPDGFSLPTSNGNARRPFTNDVPYTPSAPDSAVWAALSPMSTHSRPSSPPGEITDARMPRSPSGRRGVGGSPTSGTGFTPTFRAYSPSAHLDSPGMLGVPSRARMQYDSGGEDQDDMEDDPMLPAQYARRIPSNAGASSSQQQNASPYFDLTSGRGRTAMRSRPNSEVQWSWTWRFPLGNRYRSLTIGVPPAWEARIMRQLGWTPSSSVGNRDRMVLLKAFAADVWAAAWPPLSVFFFIAMIMFW